MPLKKKNTETLQLLQIYIFCKFHIKGRLYVDLFYFMFLHLLHFIHSHPLLLLLFMATGRCCSTANLCSDRRFCLRLCQRNWNTDFSGRNTCGFVCFFEPGDFFLPSVNLGKNSNPATPRVFFFSYFILPLFCNSCFYCAIFPQTGEFSLRTGHALPLACKSLSLDCLKHLPSRFTGSSVFTALAAL